MILCENNAMLNKGSGLHINPWEGPVLKRRCKEIFEVAKRYLNKPIKSISVLDVGSGHGEYSAEMAKLFGQVTGVEPIRMSIKWPPKKN